MDKGYMFFCGKEKNREGKVGKYQTKYTMRDSSNESRKEKSSSWLNCMLQDDELYKVIQVGTWSYWVSIGRYWFKPDSTWSVQGTTG